MTSLAFPSLLGDPEAVQLVRYYTEAGHDIRFVGGCVRDSLRGVPLKDIDFATSLPPEQGLELLQHHKVRVIPTGIAYGTITAHLNNRNFEITTLRQDTQTDGRHAVVAYTHDWQQDAARRDFTVNALSVDPSGKLYDYYDGLHDLQSRTLRFIGDATARIREDYLRILRYFRFAATWDWHLTETPTLAICQAQAPHLKDLSRERIQNELYRLVMGNGAVRILRLMQDYHLLDPLFGFKTDFSLLEELIACNDPDPFRRLWSCNDPLNTAWLDPVIVLSNAQKKRLANFPHIHTNAAWPLHKKLYYFESETVTDWAYLCQHMDILPAVAAWQKPAFPVDSSTLIARTGLQGKALGDTLKRLELYWVEQQFKPDKDALLALV